MKSSIVNNIKALPPLSSTIVKINQVYADENSTLKDMANAIEQDPMLIANILKIANSPLYGFGSEIKNASQAVNLFGMSMTRSIAIGNSIRKLLNVDMQPYNITSDEFARISLLQATLTSNWYKKIDKKKAEKLYLAAFLQETGKILISSEIIQNDETTTFKSEVESSNNLAVVERAYVDASCAEVTALVFKHWGFESDFIEIIKYSDDPSSASDEIKEYSRVLNIVKTIIPINKPFSDIAINFGLKKALDANYSVELLQETINSMKEEL